MKKEVEDILRLIPSPIVIIDNKGENILYKNEEFKKISGNKCD